MALITLVLLCVPAFASAAPDDPYFSLQWALRTIHAEPAWTVSRGADTIVAVVDTGVDLDHPDLRDRMLPGRDFADGDEDPSDDNGHGTIVAGIIAASTFNGIGVASTAPSARILPVRVLGSDGTGSSAAVVDGIQFALDHGASVINLSLAQEGGKGLFGGDLLRDPSVDDAIRNASKHGAVVVVAAGNNHDGGTSRTSYDATEPGVVVVGASTKTDRRAAYSNFGPGLDVLAPGGGSATDPSADTGCTDHNAIVSTWWDPKAERSSYGAGCGTSMAVGFVSGVAALLHARGKTNAQIVSTIKSTAVDLNARGRDDQTGFGRVDAARALGAKIPRPVKRNVSAGGSPSTGSSVRVSGHVEGGAGAPTVGKTTGRKPDRVTPFERASGPLPSGGDQGRGWPVPVSGLLLSFVALAHCARWLLAAQSKPRA